MKVFSVLCLFIVTLTYTGAQFPPVPADGSCEPGKTYQQDCNTCRCGNDGKIGACTYKLCITKAKRQVSDTLPRAPTDGICTPGQAYQLDCNTCRCGADGKLAGCTLKACPPAQLTKRSADPQQCIAGEVRQESCNTCHCTNGVWSCTRRICPGGRIRRSTPLQPVPADGKCVPGNSYKDDCNVCRCLDNGALACTEKACVSLKPKRSAGAGECSEGETKQADCNTCTCAKGGLWACTKRACLGPPRYRRDI